MIDLKLLSKAIDTIQEDKKRTTFCINMPIALRDKIMAYAKKNKIKNIIKTGFKIGDYEDIIFYSQQFALVDINGNIRGYYSGMKTEDISQ